MTKEEREHIDNRILYLDIKIESEIIHLVDDTFFGTSKENFDLLEKGMMACKKFLNENHETHGFAFFSKHISKLEQLFTLISKP
jgi:hypothetical protein